MPVHLIIRKLGLICHYENSRDTVTPIFAIQYQEIASPRKQEQRPSIPLYHVRRTIPEKATALFHILLVSLAYPIGTSRLTSI